MVNINELKAAMVRKGKTQKEVANDIGISPRSLTNKMKSGIFLSNEIEAMIRVLDIKNPVDLFFAQ